MSIAPYNKNTGTIHSIPYVWSRYFFLFIIDLQQAIRYQVMSINISFKLQDKNMMADKNVDVKYVANLARIELQPEEEKIFQTQMEQIIGYVQKLSELSLEGVEATAHPVPLKNVLREDVKKDGLLREVALNNAPLTDGENFLVPQII
jgi:aspartyl-tRNA(Asn)/glutamyl-tRNA(Gln) amidotransferase subunit C